jgi:hypothetical protein
MLSALAVLTLVPVETAVLRPAGRRREEMADPKGS